MIIIHFTFGDILMTFMNAFEEKNNRNNENTFRNNLYFGHYVILHPSKQTNADHVAKD